MSDARRERPSHPSQAPAFDPAFDGARSQPGLQPGVRPGQPQHLLFSLAGADFALPAEAVQGVERTLEITPVPNTQPWVAGVVQAWGGIISVVDLQSFCGLEPQPLTARSRLIVVARSEMIVGLLVNAVIEMRALGDDLRSRLSNSAPPWIQPYAVGALQMGERPVTIIDPDALILSQKMQAYRAD